MAPYNSENFSLFGGDWKKSSNQAAVTRRVKRIFSSPTYNQMAESDGDFALIELDSPMPITDCIWLDDSKAVFVFFVLNNGNGFCAIPIYVGGCISI